MKSERLFAGAKQKLAVKIEEYKAKNDKKERKLRFEKLAAAKEQLAATEALLQKATTPEEQQALEKKKQKLVKDCECLQYGSYYYKRRQQEAKEKAQRAIREEKKQAQLKVIDDQIAQLEALPQSKGTDSKIASLKKKRKFVDIGRIGLRREKADVVQKELDQLHSDVVELDKRIRFEKGQGSMEEKEIFRQERKLEKLKAKERKLKDKIRTLRQAHFMTIQRRKSLTGLMFIAPWLIGFLWLWLYPFIQTIRLSFGEIVDLKNYTISYIGTDHFEDLLFRNIDALEKLIQVLTDSFTNMLMITVFAFYIATLLNRKIRFRGLFRVICFLPVMLGSGFIMQQLLGQDVTKSSMQAVMDFLLPQEIQIYIGPKLVNAVIFFLQKLTLILWHSGVQILIFLSGLQSIPSTLYEASRVDGATEWENLWFITVPMMTPMILLNLVYTIIDTFNDSSNGIISLMNLITFERGDYAYGAAMAIFFMLFALLLVGLVFLVMRPFTKNSKS